MSNKGHIHPTRIFKEPNEIFVVWGAYKKDIANKEEEWQKVQYVGKDGDRVVDKVKIPYTLEGFKRYCWDENIGDIKNYFENSGGLYEDFKGVCSRIINEIRENQITGGMSGFFNPSITQRLNGLTEKKEIEHKGGLNIPNLPDIGERK